LKVLVLTQYFWPESFRINELVRSLRGNGCDVTVLAGQPNYPEGKVFTGYRALSVRRQIHPEGYTVFRVPLVPRGKASGVRLAANYLSFAAAASLLGPWLLRGKPFDVVFVYAPSPITQAIPGVVLKHVKGAALVTWVQDLWPESLASTGFVKNQTVLRLVGSMVKWLYRQHDLLLGQSRSFADSLRQSAPGVPVEYFPNPGEASFDETAEPARETLRLEPGFNVVFAGNLGKVQSLGTVLDAAELMRKHQHVRFVLVGSGSQTDWLRSEIARRDLTNVVLAGRFPAEDMPAILRQASVLLVSLIRSEIMSQTIPAKVQAYLAAGKPVIASLDGEGASVIRESGAGIAVPAEDAAALATAVTTLYDASQDERDRMGEAGRSWYRTHFSPDVLARTLLDRLRPLTLPS
jgi:glycosyltransferase involved in cell wall biosynthesis